MTLRNPPEWSQSVKITRDQNKLVRKMLEERCSAYKNWIASAVEQRDFERATALTIELRTHEQMYHIFVPDDMWKG